MTKSQNLGTSPTSKVVPANVTAQVDPYTGNLNVTSSRIVKIDRMVLNIISSGLLTGLIVGVFSAVFLDNYSAVLTTIGLVVTGLSFTSMFAAFPFLFIYGKKREVLIKALSKKISKWLQDQYDMNISRDGVRRMAEMMLAGKDGFEITGYGGESYFLTLTQPGSYAMVRESDVEEISSSYDKLDTMSVNATGKVSALTDMIKQLSGAKLAAEDSYKVDRAAADLAEALETYNSLDSSDSEAAAIEEEVLLPILSSIEEELKPLQAIPAIRVRNDLSSQLNYLNSRKQESGYSLTNVE